MAAILASAGVRGSATTGTTITPALPASLAATDLMVAVVSIKSNAAISTPAGWTQIQQTNSGASFTTAVYWRAWQAGDAAPAFTWTGSVNNEAQILRITGAKTSAPIGTVGTVATGTTSPHTSTGFNSTANNSMILLIDAAAAATALTNPAGWTALAGGATNVAELTYASKAIATSGSGSGNTSSTGAAAAWTQQQIEILYTAALVLDGTATGTFSGATSGTVTLTSAAAGDIICVAVAAEIFPTTSTPTISSVTASGLTFANRKTLAGTAVGLFSNNNGGQGSILAFYWAYASAALSATVITVTLGQTVDDAAIVAFAVANADTVTPFDTNSSLPASTTSATHSAVAPTATGISTNALNTMLIGLMSGFNNSGAATWPQAPGTGFVAVANANNAGGSLQAGVAAEAQVVSALQANATLGFGGTYQDFYLIMDAIRAPSQSPAYRPLRQYLRR